MAALSTTLTYGVVMRMTRRDMMTVSSGRHTAMTGSNDTLEKLHSAYEQDVANRNEYNSHEEESDV